MGSLGFPEMLVIGVVALLVFGPKRLPEIGAGLGKAIRDFKSAMSETTSQIKDQIEQSNTETKAAETKANETKSIAPAAESKPAEHPPESTKTL